MQVVNIPKSQTRAPRRRGGQASQGQYTMASPQHYDDAPRWFPKFKASQSNRPSYQEEMAQMLPHDTSYGSLRSTSAQRRSSLSPDKKRRVQFNQVSADNPFSAAPQVSGGGEVTQTGAPRGRYTMQPTHAWRTLHVDEDVRYMKITETSARNRNPRSYKFGTRKRSKSQRGMTEQQHIDMMKEEMEEDRFALRRQSQYTGLSPFQQVMVARARDRSSQSRSGKKQKKKQNTEPRSGYKRGGRRSKSRSPSDPLEVALTDLDRNKIRNMRSSVYLPLSNNYNDLNNSHVVEQGSRYAIDNLDVPQQVRQSRNRSQSPPAARLGGDYSQQPRVKYIVFDKARGQYAQPIRERNDPQDYYQQPSYIINLHNPAPSGNLASSFMRQSNAAPLFEDEGQRQRTASLLAYIEKDQAQEDNAMHRDSIPSYRHHEQRYYDDYGGISGGNDGQYYQNASQKYQQQQQSYDIQVANIDAPDLRASQHESQYRQGQYHLAQKMTSPHHNSMAGFGSVAQRMADPLNDTIQSHHQMSTNQQQQQQIQYQPMYQHQNQMMQGMQQQSMYPQQHAPGNVSSFERQSQAGYIPQQIFQSSAPPGYMQQQVQSPHNQQQQSAGISWPSQANQMTQAPAGAGGSSMKHIQKGTTASPRAQTALQIQTNPTFGQEDLRPIVSINEQPPASQSRDSASRRQAGNRNQVYEKPSMVGGPDRNKTEQVETKGSKIEQAILDLPNQRRTNDPDARNETMEHNQKFRVLQEPIYRNVSQDVLKDFNRRKLTDIEQSYPVSPECRQRMKNDPAFRGQFRATPFENEPADDETLSEIAQEVQSQGQILEEEQLISDRRGRKQQQPEVIIKLPNGFSPNKKKEQMLNAYIAYSALRIQRVYRGHKSRKLMPFFKALGPDGLAKLEAAMVGWKTRKILSMREVKNKASLVRDHDRESARQAIAPNVLQSSKKQAQEKFGKFFETMYQDSHWLLLNKESLFKEGGRGRRYQRNQHVDSTNGIIKRNRGNQQQIRPSQINHQEFTKSASPSPVNKSPPQPTLQSFQCSNKFQPNFQAEWYKAAAKEQFKRRMTYDPHKSIMENKSQLGHKEGQSQVKEYINGDSPADQRRSRVDRKIEQLSKSLIEIPRRHVDRNLGGKFNHSYIQKGQEPLQWRSPAKEQTLDGLRQTRQEARESLERRRTYIPDIKKRYQKQMQSAKAISPENELNNYLGRKQIRASMLDKVDSNPQLTVDDQVLRSHYSKPPQQINKIERIDEEVEQQIAGAKNYEQLRQFRMPNKQESTSYTASSKKTNNFQSSVTMNQSTYTRNSQPMPTKPTQYLKNDSKTAAIFKEYKQTNSSIGKQGESFTNSYIQMNSRNLPTKPVDPVKAAAKNEPTNIQFNNNSRTTVAPAERPSAPTNIQLDLNRAREDELQQYKDQLKESQREQDKWIDSIVKDVRSKKASDAPKKDTLPKNVTSVSSKVVSTQQIKYEGLSNTKQQQNGFKIKPKMMSQEDEIIAKKVAQLSNQTNQISRLQQYKNSLIKGSSKTNDHRQSAIDPVPKLQDPSKYASISSELRESVRQRAKEQIKANALKRASFKNPYVDAKQIKTIQGKQQKSSLQKSSTEKYSKKSNF